MVQVGKLIVLVFIILLSAQDSNSQDEITRYDKILNPWVLNPALTGAGDNTLNFYVNKQWLGFHGAPLFYGFHVDSRLATFDFYTNRMFLNKTSYKSKGNVGLGAALIRDGNGPYSYSELKINYSYHIQLSKANLSFGLANDIEIYGIHESEMNPLVPNDPKIEGINRSKIFYNPGVGVLFYSEFYEAGLSVNNIAGEKLVLKDDYIEFYNNLRTYAIHGSYRFRNFGNISIEPQIMIGTHGFDDLLYSISGSFILKEDYKISLTYESLNYFVLHAGIDMGKYFLIYGFSSPFGSLPKYMYGSHEITIGMKFGAYVY